MLNSSNNATTTAVQIMVTKRPRRKGTAKIDDGYSNNSGHSTFPGRSHTQKHIMIFGINETIEFKEISAVTRQ